MHSRNRVAGRRSLAALSAAALVGLALSACSAAGDDMPAEESTEHFAYQVPSRLTTSNAGSDVGASELAQMLSARVYPGVFVPGPDGQTIPNTDLVRTQPLPGAKRIVQYQLTPEAVYSDGAQVTCTDYLLASTAGSNPDLFGSHMPVFSDVESVTCEPGAKNFDVVFKEGRGGRWRELFAPGTVVPAHAVAAKLGTDEAGLNAQLHSGDADALRSIGAVWHDGFNLAEFDPEMQVSSGPYKIDSVGEAGQVTLAANEYYYGDAPLTEQVVVWPMSADSAGLQRSGNLRAAELTEPNPQWFDANAQGNALEVSTVAGSMTDSLTFADSGPWSLPENRQALAKCVDPRSVAAASSRASGIEVPASPVHLLAQNDPQARRLDDITAPHLDVDVEAAKAAQGLELRVGYGYPSGRMAAMVEAIRVSCEPAGITVVDATEGGKTLRDLPRTGFSEDGVETEVEGTVDAVLRPVSPLAEYSGTGSRSQDMEGLREREKQLWEELPSLPLSAQPRTFAIDRNLGNAIVYTGPAGIAWNMDRWQLRRPAAGQTQ